MLRKIFLSVLLITGFLTLEIHSVTAQQTVIGQDNPAVDVEVVQAAVGKGGEILLKGTFDFGEKGSVTINKDVKIVGERDSQGILITKVKGGLRTFLSPLPAQLPPQVPGPKIAIQYIHFDGTQAFPIYIAYCSGATIAGNKITNVRPIVTPQMNFSVGIMVGTNWIQPAATRKYQPGAVTGIITIVDNDLDMANDTPAKTFGQGIFVHWATGITLQVSGNTVKNCSRNSIEAMDNYLGDDGSGSVVIRDNKVTTATLGLPFPSPRTPNGILVGWFLDGTGAGASNPKQNMKATITNNTVRALGETSMGMWIASNEAIVENNQIITEKQSATPIFINSGYCQIMRNKIEGMGASAIYISPSKSLIGSSNRCIENDLSAFKAEKAEVIFEKESKNNSVEGSGGKAKDLGIDNQIKGLTRITE
ncbi:MAG: right-handed parallel beta-helix repeat-containing protein [Thermodesulfobacteriota bacterium]|nr:right-handed parallel beta-helix repeat-containing protein [Thermodesulfobacteriota bacterium]